MVRVNDYYCLYLALLDSKGIDKQRQIKTSLIASARRGSHHSFIQASRFSPGCLPSFMTKTRRQSKVAAAAATGTSTRGPSPVPAQEQTTFSVVIPEDVDFDLLSNLLPEMQLDSPSPEAIVSLYRLIAGQASEIDATTRELEGTKAEVERKDIELDQALQDRESASRELETTLENVQNELRQVKQEKEEIGMCLSSCH